jgi:hypothetical protein
MFVAAFSRQCLFGDSQLEQLIGAFMQILQAVECVTE